MKIDVIIPAHNPDPERLKRVLDALAAQTLPLDQWSVVLVDNCSTPLIEAPIARFDLRVVREDRLGANWARLRGLKETSAEIVVNVDDDNLLAPDYLAQTAEIALRQPDIGAFSGRVVAELEGGHTPPPWVLESLKYCFALRDFGDEEITTKPTALNPYPEISPGGAGMVLRRSAVTGWIVAAELGGIIADRVGDSLSTGDMEMVAYCLKAGFGVGYFPQLELTHVLPARRFTTPYLARLNYGISRGWSLFQYHHGFGVPVPAHPATIWLRKARSYLQHRAWRKPEGYVRWRGLCAIFDTRADVWRDQVVSRGRYDG